MANNTAAPRADGRTVFTSESGITVRTDTSVNGTSQVLGGDIALVFNGQRTGYLDFQSSALTVKTALESLSTVGAIDVSRAGPDENYGNYDSRAGKISRINSVCYVKPLDLPDKIPVTRLHLLRNYILQIVVLRRYSRLFNN